MATLSKEDREPLDLRSEVTQQWKTTVSSCQALHTEHALTSALSVWWGSQPKEETALQSICEGIPRAVQLSCEDSSQLFRVPSVGWLPTRDKHEKANWARTFSASWSWPQTEPLGQPCPLHHDGFCLLNCEPKLALSPSTNFPSGLQSAKRRLINTPMQVCLGSGEAHSPLVFWFPSHFCTSASSWCLFW